MEPDAEHLRHELRALLADLLRAEAVRQRPDQDAEDLIVVERFVERVDEQLRDLLAEADIPLPRRAPRPRVFRRAVGTGCRRHGRCRRDRPSIGAAPSPVRVPDDGATERPFGTLGDRVSHRCG
jgi:hypothetical protein